ncbi:MAG: MarC family NAAT transporter [Bacteroidetes bacterium]|jgi:multiple antibiotic resistance protein|nr:MarC family NAAT transporter [Bacteroidota bacterium]
MTYGLDFYLIFLTGLVTMMNPLSVVPVFLGLTHDRDEKEKRRILWRVANYGFFMLVVVLLAGSYILNFFGITIPALRIGGSILIMNSGYNMLQNRGNVSKKTLEQDNERDDISFAPLTMPLTVGPGTIALTLSYAERVPALWNLNGVMVHVFLLAAILVAMALVYLVLRSSEYLQRVLGHTGIAAMTRIMGFIVLCIGIQILLSTTGELLRENGLISR